MLKRSNNMPSLGVEMQAIHDKYMASLRADRTPKNTLDIYGKQSKDFLAHCESRGHKDLKTVRKADCLAFKDEVGTRISLQTGKPLDAVTARLYLSCANTFLKWAYEYDLMDQSIRCPYPRVNKKAKKEPLSEEKIMKMVEAAKKMSGLIYCIILFLVETGRRQSEIRNILKEDVDTKKRKATLRQTKRGQDEEIFLTIPLCEAIDRYREDRITPPKAEDNVFLFITDARNYEGRMGENFIGLAVEGVAIEAGIREHITPHQLRHAYDTRGHGKAPDRVMGAQTGQTAQTIDGYVNPYEVEKRKFVDDNSIFAMEGILVQATTNGESKAIDKSSKIAELRLLLMEQRLQDKLTDEVFFAMRADLEREDLK